MAVRVRIPIPLRPLTGGKAEVQAAGGNVQEVLRDLDSRHPGIEMNVLVDGRMRRFVSVYLNGHDIRYLTGLATPTRDGDLLSIAPAISGTDRRS
jgi:molybdopterin synthase sulfur carrier subunit